MPPKDPSSPSKPGAVPLRRVTIFTFPPAFLLLLVHGIASNRPFPALGLLPLAGSAILGCLILYHDRVVGSGSSIQRPTTSNIFFADVLLAIMLLAILIASWVTLTKNLWRYDNGSLIILGTYCTVFLLVNFIIHAYFAGLQFLHMMTARSCNCAHCQSVTKSGPLMRMVSEYSPLNGDDLDEEDSYTDVEAGNRTTSL
ncbi:nucleosome binding protein [Diplodia corticola]|uniref:Nucleosome binding protein n=1 Tax=Diplodia corticola TaxID=236234 RepID=A0A1J9RIN1_9PEZI|nr:nucleosome binding protein [Diplodia corticola]OJD39882.1 nucleosome binding protein [Diplodia corticola]